MGCVQIIKEGMDHFTEGESKIAKYIIDNRDLIIDLSTSEMADSVGVSTATIVRFSQKIGYRGFSDLKIALAKESGMKEIEDIHTVLKESDTLAIMIQKAESININNMIQTYQMLHPEQLEQIVNKVVACDNIYLFGVGASGLVALDLQHKLSRIHIPTYFNQDPHINLGCFSHIAGKDVAIIISYRGETKEALLAAQVAKEKGAVLVVVTQMNYNPLAKLADYCLYIPNEEKEIRVGAITSRISALLVTDLLYLAIAKHDFEETERCIMQTRELVAKLH